MSNRKRQKINKHFKETSIAEFFEKNRHLLGFDNPRKALLIAVKELVDNSLDACEEARILPEIKVIIRDLGDDTYLVRVEDNGPGIPKEHVPNVYGKFLYGTKFHRYIVTRGKQGIGVSALTLYSQLTTGKPIKVITKTEDDILANYFEIKIDVKRNEPIIVNYKKVDEKIKHGTIIEVIIKGKYTKGRASVDEYIKLTALANPHANITYITPKGEKFVYRRITTYIPELKELKPHPHGIEIGILSRMLKDTKTKTLLKFLTKEFSSVGKNTALEIIRKAGLDPNKDPHELSEEEVKKLYNAMINTKIRAPPAKVLITLGEDLIRESLLREFNPEFVAARKRPPSTYRGLPFIVEVGIAYGGNIKSEKAMILRFANRVPLLYKAGECAITQAIKEFNWKNYKIKTGDDKIPQGPLVIFVHISSVWIPFTSESKEAIAQYPEIIREIKLALRDVARELSIYLSKKKAINEISNKYLAFYGYGIELAKALSKLLDIDEETVRKTIEKRVKEELKRDLVSIIQTVKDIRELIIKGNTEGVLRYLKRVLGPVVSKKIIEQNEIREIVNQIAKNIKSKNQ